MMQSRPLRIAYVEDDEHLRGLVEIALTAGGHEVALFASGAEALDGVAKFAPDVLLLDVIMPQMDGFETLAQLRASRVEYSPVVAFVTGMSRPADQQRCIEAGAAMISKPINPMALAGQVSALFAERGAPR